MNKKVVVTDYSFPDVQHERSAAESLGASFEAHQVKSDEEMASIVTDADVVAVQFAHFGPLSAKAVRKGATIIRYGVGYDNIDLNAAHAAELKVGYVPDYCADEVAEHTVAMMLSSLRKISAFDESIRAGEWAAVKVAKPMKPFAETNIGFFGFGQIGRSVREKLAGFGFNVLVSDPMLSNEEAKSLNVEIVTADDLLLRADLISLHAPATKETIGFFNKDCFARMRDHAVIVNSARGALINEGDLAQAVNAGQIGGAALDVFCNEPLEASSPLLGVKNIILSPHAAWYSEAAIDKLQSLVAEDISLALSGKKPRFPVM